jgi:hypothetical protein
MIAVIVGVVFVLLGIWGAVAWFPEVLVIVKGFGSVSLIIGGVVAVIAGMSSLKSMRPNAPKE